LRKRGAGFLHEAIAAMGLDVPDIAN